MPRFLRFVVITSLMLLCLYIFYPTPQEVPAGPAPSSKHPGTEPIATFDVAQQEPRDSLRSRLAIEFPYNVLQSFPNFIWQTWKTTPSEADFNFRTPEASWTAKHPDYIHEVITDDIASRLVHHLYARVPEVCEAYDALPKAILKADFFRYLILLARGGIYSDIDTEALRPAWEWVPLDLMKENYGLIVGIEADPDRPDWNMWYSRRVQLCQWTIRAKPGHPALIEAVATLTESTMAMVKNGTIEGDGLRSIVEWTGPGMWTDAVFKYLNTSPDPLLIRGRQEELEYQEGGVYSWKNLTGMTEAKKILDVVILPITGFSPGQGHMGSEDFTDTHAMVKHDFEGSWKPESERMKEE